MKKLSKPEPFKFSKETPVEIPKGQFFEVVGAGKIKLSDKPTALCGKAAGFSFGVSWSRMPFTGGVIGIDDAKRMALFILDECSKIEEKEKDLHDRLWREHDEQLENS